MPLFCFAYAARVYITCCSGASVCPEFLIGDPSERLEGEWSQWETQKLEVDIAALREYIRENEGLANY